MSALSLSPRLSATDGRDDSAFETAFAALLRTPEDSEEERKALVALLKTSHALPCEVCPQIYASNHGRVLVQILRKGLGLEPPLPKGRPANGAAMQPAP